MSDVMDACKPLAIGSVLRGHLFERHAHTTLEAGGSLTIRRVGGNPNAIDEPLDLFYSVHSLQLQSNVFLCQHVSLVLASAYLHGPQRCEAG